jgi:hypothetical protein
MPMPKMKPGESKEDFIKRFMEDENMIKEYPDEKDRKAMAKKMCDEKKTFSLDNVEIFEVGKWNGDKYSEKDLDDMVAAFQDTREALKPHVKLGHSNKQDLLQKDGYPSAGWITDLKRVGKKLVAKIEGIPEKIYGLIQSKAYGRISSEIFWNLSINGKKHRRALKAIALLGADTPEVHSLNDFINLYTENYDAELKIYYNKDTDMSDDNKVKNLETQLNEYKLKLSEAQKENEELREYSAKIEYEKELTEIKSYFNQKLEEGKITPKQFDYYVALSVGNKEVKTYTNDKAQKIEGNCFDLVKGIIENGTKQVDFSENSQHKEVEKKPEMSDDDKLVSRIKEYMSKHNVSYNEAFDVVSYEEVN